MFALNEKVVYPGYGVALVTKIIEKSIDGLPVVLFYELHLLQKNIKILVPMESAEFVGIRKLESRETISKLMKELAEPYAHATRGKYTINNWNKRNKEYQLKLRTGKLKDLSDIYKDLQYIAQSKELSFGEKNILQQTEALLAEEISIIEQKQADMTIEQLRLVCSDSAKRIYSL